MDIGTLPEQSARTAEQAPSVAAGSSFGFRGVARQVWHDITGKDVQDTPTLTYTWCADQFGHFTLGFVSVLALTVLGIAVWGAVNMVSGATRPADADFRCAAVAGVVVAIAFATKEALDYVSAKANAKGVFHFNRREVLNNVYVACFYTFAGALMAVTAFWSPWWIIPVALVLAVPIVWVGVWWLERKIAFQQADLPFLYRLANFPRNFEHQDDVRLIAELADPSKEPTIRHIIIDGPLCSGKTCLGIGVATDFAFQKRLARFTSLVKLNQLVVRSPRRGEAGVPTRTRAKGAGVHLGTEFRDGRTLWPFEDVDLLIVDDLDFGLVPPNPVQPDVVEHILLNEPGRAFFATFRNRRTLWLAGTSNHLPKWNAMIVADLVAGGDQSAVHVVRLKGHLNDSLSASNRSARRRGSGGPPKPADAAAGR